MAHSATQEADGADSTMDGAASAIDKLFGASDIDEGGEDDDNTDDQDQDEGDELDLGDDEDGDDDEPGQPAIEVPASLTAEEKVKFAALPKEAQSYVADLEARRASQVQTATTKAAEAQRTAEMRAARADAEAKAVYAQQLQAFADQMAPQMPDPRLAQENPGLYIAHKAQYDADLAQHNQFVQQIQAMGQQAESSMTEAEVQARDAELMLVPEVQNADTRETFFKRAIDAGNMLGLDMSQIGSATAKELKALREISTYKEKADKYDAAMAKQMQRVRDGKRVTATPGAAQPRGSGFGKARDKAKQTGSVHDAAAALAKAGF